MRNNLGKAGTLYVVATPIGNLEDFSARGVRILSSVSVIAAEDTRRTRKLLHRYTLDTPLVAYHDHTKSAQRERLLRRLELGEDIALVTDAGTPLISDPGYRLVDAAHVAGVRVVPIPGANAALAALSVAGLPSDRFVFEGFLPAKESARRRRLRELKTEVRTLLFYESVHRIQDTLADLAEVFGTEREAVLARELTKEFETVLRGTLGALVDRLSRDSDQRRGEFVILVKGDSGPPPAVPLEPEKVAGLLAEVLPISRAAEIAARITGTKRNVLYRQLLESRPGDSDGD
ncbi:MAG: 16S rRNA (cytidine(1402)-2'-O)-methyltransferase [Gammaproteobacteria bacterium]|nr:16S rRNA (cytidine(1402)-2'-O)-methyltransferase [Gammaproteobacteria bacterium]